MKVVYVTPRYGEEVVGGAELAAKMIAERLVAQTDFEVEVFTSAALESSTWENWYEPGTVELNGVKVHRFPTTHPRSPEFEHTSLQVHNNLKLSSPQLQEQWIDEQGPTAPQLLDAISDSDADVFAFYPYLYYPTVRGVDRVRPGAVSLMHPAAHDEAAIRMSIFNRVFGKTDAFAFHVDAERKMVEEFFPSAVSKPQILLGLGVDLPDKSNAEVLKLNEKAFREKYEIGDAPFIVCLGRLDKGKGAHLLADYFSAYKERNPGSLKLVFVGPVIHPLDATNLTRPLHPDVVVAGRVSDEEKLAALGGAEVLVSPSAFESFSLVLVESWAMGTPVLVNRRCVATMEHVERSHGGLWFGGYGEFEASLQKLFNDPALASTMARLGYSYVQENFEWKSLIARYAKFLEHVTQRHVTQWKASRQ